MSNEVVATKKKSILVSLSEKYGVEPMKIQQTLAKTAFTNCKNEEQFIAMCVVANQYDLNPFLKELYAFPDKAGGVVPVVGVDGWHKLTNGHPQYDGCSFEVINDQTLGLGIKCTIYRKDRQHPEEAIEWMNECKRNTEAWKTHPMRMLRHKAFIQAARQAFSFGGIYEQDEAEAIAHNNTIVAQAGEQKKTLTNLLRAKANKEEPVEISLPPQKEEQPTEISDLEQLEELM